ncbi:manganese-dependent ADP-ribose/CDP-alcohol diphosphatase [Patella vulgata]|uniref:manganese-dependent ADP-ribose/CDP-alcohol diphosphatase n=1 Tax=Patella vulgata TaxID=6465 RepID=UPI00217F9660|nr:manganese-dependent ADP-ribose/CDP-alcohol diphosphatase [Patella vulgata]
MPKLYTRILKLLVYRSKIKRYLKKMATIVKNQEPLMVFAALSDIQYGDMDDGYNFKKTGKRYYRNALVFQKQVIEQWKNMTPEVKFILQLGDIIDGFNKRHGISESSLQKTLDVFGDFKTYHVIGNHELYNFDRAALMKTPLFSAGLPECKSSIASTNQFYYSFLPDASLRIIAIDTYEIAEIGWPESSTNYQEAMKYLENNINEDKNSCANMTGTDRRFARFNGGVSSTQLKWLNQLLEECDKKKENVIIIGHLPIHPSAAAVECLCWNYEEILSILYNHDCVISYMAGHDHVGGSGIDEHHIQHITIPAILETPPDRDPPMATLSLYNDILHIDGQYLLDNYDIKLKFPIV